jgi:hypothetical protein
MHDSSLWNKFADRTHLSFTFPGPVYVATDLLSFLVLLGGYPVLLYLLYLLLDDWERYMDKREGPCVG